MQCQTRPLYSAIHGAQTFGCEAMITRSTPARGAVALSKEPWTTPKKALPKAYCRPLAGVVPPKSKARTSSLFELSMTMVTPDALPPAAMADGTPMSALFFGQRNWHWRRGVPARNCQALP
jgi:hypothetical protein